MRQPPSDCEEFNRRARELALMIQGRVIHEIMEKFWPAAAHDASLEPFLQEYGRIWTDAPKVLVSNTRTTADHDTRSSAARTRSNKLLLFVHPVVLGSGRPLFDDLATPVECDLLEHQVFEQGVAMHRYRVRGAR